LSWENTRLSRLTITGLSNTRLMFEHFQFETCLVSTTWKDDFGFTAVIVKGGVANVSLGLLSLGS